MLEQSFKTHTCMRISKKIQWVDFFVVTISLYLKMIHLYLLNAYLYHSHYILSKNIMLFLISLPSQVLFFTSLWSVWRVSNVAAWNTCSESEAMLRSSCFEIELPTPMANVLMPALWAKSAACSLLVGEIDWPSVTTNRTSVTGGRSPAPGVKLCRRAKLIASDVWVEPDK